jgi:uncharacterized membrane protein
MAILVALRLLQKNCESLYRLCTYCTCSALENVISFILHICFTDFMAAVKLKCLITLIISRGALFAVTSRTDSRRHQILRVYTRIIYVYYGEFLMRSIHARVVLAFLCDSHMAGSGRCSFCSVLWFIYIIAVVLTLFRDWDMPESGSALFSFLCDSRMSYPARHVRWFTPITVQ